MTPATEDDAVRAPPATDSRRVVSSLTWNFSWTFAANIAYAGSQFLLVVAIARLGNPEMLGVFVLALSIVGPIFLITSLKLRAVLVTDAAGQFAFGHYMAVRILSVSTALVFATVVAALVSSTIEAFLAVVLVGISGVANGVSEILLGYLQQHERMGRVAASRILKAVLQIPAFVILLSLTGSLLPAIIGWTLVSIVTMVAYDVPVVRRAMVLDAGPESPATLEAVTVGSPSPTWNREAVIALVRLSLPLGVAVALGAFWINVPRYFVSASEGTAKLGIFAAIVSLTVIGTTVVGAIGVAATPRLARFATYKNLEAYDRLLARLVLIGVSVGILGVVVALGFGEAILEIVYGAGYAAYSELLLVVVVAVAIRLSFLFLGSGIQALRNFKVQAPIQAGSVGIIVMAAWWLVPRYGILGGGVAMLAAAIFELCAYTLAFIVVRRHAGRAGIRSAG